MTPVSLPTDLRSPPVEGSPQRGRLDVTSVAKPPRRPSEGSLPELGSSAAARTLRPGGGSIPKPGSASQSTRPQNSSQPPRSGVLKEPRTGTRARPTVSPRSVRDETQAKARRMAHQNAAEMEWTHTIRPALQEMARRGMSSAEVGARLADLLRRSPGLIAEGQGPASQVTEGEGESSSRIP